jgi:glycosyltransferase involved in cell wall biosynthesis
VDVPVVLTLHSDVLSWRHWTLGSSSDIPSEWTAYHALVRTALRRADGVAAVSQFLADAVRAQYAFDGPIRVIHNGWPAPARVELPKEPISLVAGRIWDPAKNVGLVAEAARSWDPGAVYLAGERAHPDSGLEVDIPPPLRALGFLPRTDLDRWLDRAEIYISPARYDPFGLLPLQAALHGCTLLLSDIPSYRELWNGVAHFFRADDPNDLRRVWQSVRGAPPEPLAYERALRYAPESMTRAYRNMYAGLRHRLAA